MSCGRAAVSKLITLALTQINKQSSSWGSLGNIQRDSKADYDPDLALFLTRVNTVWLQNSAGQNRKLADIITLLILQLWKVIAGIHFLIFSYFSLEETAASTKIYRFRKTTFSQLNKVFSPYGVSSLIVPTPPNHFFPSLVLLKSNQQQSCCIHHLTRDVSLKISLTISKKSTSAAIKANSSIREQCEIKDVKNQPAWALQGCCVWLKLPSLLVYNTNVLERFGYVTSTLAR